MKTGALLAAMLLPIVQALPAQEIKDADPGFTFKRVKPPSSGGAKRITVQIAPPAGSTETDQPGGVSSSRSSALPSSSGDYAEWFWDVITPALEPPEDGKWIEAVELASAVENAGALATPRLEDLSQIAQDYGRFILAESVGAELSPALILSVIAIESAGNPAAVSSAGAQGLMQLIPATAERFDVSDSLDPQQNIRGGVTYLKWLNETFFDDPILALAAYNAGENALRAHGGVPRFTETRRYVPKVLAAWAVARQLCITPPELPSDGCVFAQPN